MMKVCYPKPQIGYYRAECCLLDLYKIETQEELDYVLERVQNNDECGQLMVYATLADAIADLAGELPPEEETEQFRRLGWTEAWSGDAGCAGDDK